MTWAQFGLWSSDRRSTHTSYNFAKPSALDCEAVKAQHTLPSNYTRDDTYR